MFDFTLEQFTTDAARGLLLHEVVEPLHTLMLFEHSLDRKRTKRKAVVETIQDLKERFQRLRETVIRPLVELDAQWQKVAEERPDALPDLMRAWFDRLTKAKRAIEEANLAHAFQRVQGILDQQDQEYVQACLAGWQLAYHRLAALEKWLKSHGDFRGKPDVLAVETSIRPVAHYLEKQRRGKEVEVEPSNSHALISADPDHLAGVWANLVRNAIDAGAQRIVFQIARRGQDVEIAVSDDGRGIPEGLQSQIFDLGFSSKGSSGLGLWIVRETVRAAGGTIVVKSLTRQEHADASQMWRLPASDDNITIGQVGQAFVKRWEPALTTFLQRLMAAVEDIEGGKVWTEHEYTQLQETIFEDPQFVAFLEALRASHQESPGTSDFTQLAELLQHPFNTITIYLRFLAQRGEQLVESRAGLITQLSGQKKFMAHLLRWFQRVADDERLTPGTTFIVRLPAATPAALVADAPAVSADVERRAGETVPESEIQYAL